MKKNIKISALVFFAVFTQTVSAQTSYYIPTHYRGVFNGQPSSTRATGMGLTTITLEGIENAFYNPATVGLTDEKIAVHINYASGNQVYKGGKYPFLGVSYRVNEKLIVGASTLNWFDEKNSPWTTIIGGFSENVKRRSQSAYTLVGAFEVIPNLNLGLSGNYLVEKFVNNTVTNSEFILSFGAVYDKEVNWIKAENVSNQKIRFAGSFVNLLMKNQIEQRYQNFLHYRDLPTYLTLGTSYHASLPFNVGFTQNKGFFEGAPNTVDLSLHLQYKDLMKGSKKNSVNPDHKNNTAIGIGAEAWFMDLIAIRMGYYNEKRPNGPKSGGGTWVTDNKKGFTWGFGAKLPLNRLTNGKLPFNSEVNFVTSKLLNEYGNNYTQPSYFTDRNFLFSVGINLKFVEPTKP
ncbi:hypothetical protein [Gelatiniphilus marinus]|uniref:Long-chain fatty acid transport protein n=1 Tax=Gelatiniphilus marinus TaxID=1759464 RepID=A0ABW5JW75_9FLAO